MHSPIHACLYNVLLVGLFCALTIIIIVKGQQSPCLFHLQQPFSLAAEAAPNTLALNLVDILSHNQKL